MRAAHVDGLGTFARERRTLRATYAVAAHWGRRRASQRLRLLWSRLAVHLVHSP